MRIGNLELIRNTKGFFGSGIWPFYLASPNNRYSKIFLNATCPYCYNSTGKVLPALARNFFSIFFLPLFPLNLTIVTRCQSCSHYVKLPIKEVRMQWMVDRVQNNQENHEFHGKYCTWWLPALLSFLGALIGWFTFPMMLFGTSKYFFLPLVFGFFGWNVLGKIFDSIWSWEGTQAFRLALLAGGVIGLLLSLIPIEQYGFPTLNIIGVFLGMSIFISLYFLNTINNPYQFKC